MFASNIAPRFAGVYQVVALKQDGSRDLKQEERIFKNLKKNDQDEFHKVAESLHHEERSKPGPAAGYDPARFFLFTQLNGKLTVFTGMDAQGLSMYCPSVIVYRHHKDPTVLANLDDKKLVGQLSSKKPISGASVSQYLQDFDTQPTEVDYNRFGDGERIKEQREKHEEEISALLRTNSERAVRLTPLDTSRPVPTRSYSLKFVVPTSPRSSQPTTPTNEGLLRSFSDTLENYARRHDARARASEPNTPQ